MYNINNIIYNINSNNKSRINCHLKQASQEDESEKN